MKTFILALAVMAFAVPAVATSPGDCSLLPGSVFDRSDAVVLAKVESIHREKWTPETATEPTVVKIIVQKYWKLKDDEIPKIIHSRNFDNDSGLYLVYLKQDFRDRSIYHLSRCAPIIKIYNLAPDGLEVLLNLKDVEAHDVDNVQ